MAWFGWCLPIPNPLNPKSIRGRETVKAQQGTLCGDVNSFIFLSIYRRTLTVEECHHGK